ncbi:MAG TPA: hypothetical protein VGP71_15565 [Burkholderiales bacterium]|nr:hypothetical protein [Burkholderiales bacterium]
MNTRFLALCLSLASLLAVASPNAHAQRFGDVLGSGWSMQQQSTPIAALPAERAGDPKLAGTLAKLLPVGTDLRAEASGFRTLGDFVAAAHVSNNLAIPFAHLKAKIIKGDSLGEAIQALRPDTDAQIEARKARAMAADDLARV